MKQREIVVEHKYVDGIYSHCFDNENYALLELERKVYLNENKELEDRIDKAINIISLIRMDRDTSIETHKSLDEILNVLRGSEKE